MMDSLMQPWFESWPRQSHIPVRYALKNYQFISDESFAELVLNLCEDIKCIAPSTFLKRKLLVRLVCILFLYDALLNGITLTTLRQLI